MLRWLLIDVNVANIVRPLQTIDNTDIFSQLLTPNGILYKFFNIVLCIQDFILKRCFHLSPVYFKGKESSQSKWWPKANILEKGIFGAPSISVPLMSVLIHKSL